MIALTVPLANMLRQPLLPVSRVRRVSTRTILEVHLTVFSFVPPAPSSTRHRIQAAKSALQACTLRRALLVRLAAWALTQAGALALAPIVLAAASLLQLRKPAFGTA
jgi:hypothetical protein